MNTNNDHIPTATILKDIADTKAELACLERIIRPIQNSIADRRQFIEKLQAIIEDRAKRGGIT